MSCRISADSAAEDRDQQVMEHPAAWSVPPSLVRIDHADPSVFQPERFLRDARRQRGLDAESVAAVCLRDLDGDGVRVLQQIGRSRRSETCSWGSQRAGQPWSGSVSNCFWRSPIFPAIAGCSSSPTNAFP